MKDSRELEPGSETVSDDIQTPAVESQNAVRSSEKVKCQHCGKMLPDATRFCLYCGAPTSANDDAISCPNCEAVMPIGTLFCGSCGMSFRASSPVTISGTGTLSFGVPLRARSSSPKKKSRTWLGVGAGLTVLLFLGGMWIFAGKFFEKPSPVPEPPAPKPLPSPHIPLPSPPSPPNPTLGSPEGKLPEPPPPEKPKFQPGWYEIVAEEDVPVYREPHLDGEKFAKVKPGGKVNVVDEKDKWLKIRNEKGDVGYIPRDAVSSDLAKDNGTKSSGGEEPGDERAAGT